ncbi:MAG TPA: hypothetical protein DCO79_14855 [Spirochaeta sp.]|nr:hypothetical protein [Spirochaeta sp.]
MNKILLSKSADNFIYSGVVNINIGFIKFIGNLFTTPEIIILFHLKNQIFNVSGDGFSAWCFLLVTSEAKL